MAALQIVIVLVALAGASHGAHNHGGPVPGSDEVDSAIVNIGMHYNDKLCLEILLIDCATHVTQGDEQVCGSNGKTYANHCLFTHAMCEFLHGDQHITVANHGPCGAAPTMAATTMMAGTSGAVVDVTTAASSAPIVSGASAMMTSDLPITTTTMIMTTTQIPATTADPINSIIANVFCQNAASISCASAFEIICGSDGNLYPNQCELSKAKCKDTTLTVAETSSCSFTGGK